MKLERWRLGHEAAAIKDAIRAGNQKLVFEIWNQDMCFTIFTIISIL